MNWNPDEAKLHEIRNILHKAGSSDTAIQIQVTQALNSFSTLPDSACYLTLVFTSLTNEPLEVRQRAGLLLKNLISLQSDTNLLFCDYIRPFLLKALGDDERLMRSTAGAVISALIRRFNNQNDILNDTLTSICQLIDNGVGDVVEGAFEALGMILEDEFDNKIEFNDPNSQFHKICFQLVIPKLFSICDGSHSTLSDLEYARYKALFCLNLFITNKGISIENITPTFFSKYWVIIGNLATDKSNKTRLAVVVGMVAIAEMAPNFIFNSPEAVMQFMIDCSADADYSIRLESLEFWPLILQDSRALKLLPLYFIKLLPCLVCNTIFTETDYLEMDPSHLENDNAEVQDCQHDIGPRFHVARGDTADEDEENNSGAWGNHWTTRKAAALALDHLASTYRDEILKDVLPIIENRLQDKNWEVRESAVLTLGAIARGCWEGLAPFIPRVLDFLLTLCNDSKPLLRSISCWCISRFATWLIQHDNLKYFEHTIVILNTRMLDSNKRVQEAACSSFATLEEEAQGLLIPYINHIVATFSKALTFYQHRNLLILFDAIGTMATSVGGSINTPSFVNNVMPLLLVKWESLGINDPCMIAIMECLTCITHSFGDSFVSFVDHIIKRCCELMSHILNDCKLQDAGRKLGEPPNRDVLECCLDLISAVIEVMSKSITPLLVKNNFGVLLEACCLDFSSPVKQSAFASVGDIARSSIEVLTPHLNTILPVLADHLLHKSTSVANNAGWAIGEISVKVNSETLVPYIDKITHQLIIIISKPALHCSLLVNACITLGRLGLVCSKNIAILLPDFLGHWCRVLITVRNDHEKANALHGICLALQFNMVASKTCMLPLIESIVLFQPPPPMLVDLLKSLLNSLQNEFPQEFNLAVGQSSPQVRHLLNEVYSLNFLAT